jgi:hypothetical protein
MSTTETKTTPRPETNPFAAFATFDPMTMWATSQQAFAKLMTDSVGRAHAFAEQCAAMESQWVTRAQGAVASWAQLAQDAIAYSSQLSAEARKLGFDAAQKLTVA